MKKLFQTALLLLSGLLTFNTFAANKLQVVSITAPQEVAPGQTINPSITFKVIEVDGKDYLRPFASYYLMESKKGKNMPGDQMTPWRFSNYKVGSILKVTTKITVPENAKVGEKCRVTFKVYHPESRKNAVLVGNPSAFVTVTAPKKAELAMPATAETAETLAIVPILQGKVTVDGKDDEAVWQKATVLKLEKNSASGEKTNIPAQVKVFTDGKMFYCFFTAYNVDPAKLRKEKHTRPEGAVWKNDSFEFYLTPDRGNGDYAQFMTDLLGQNYDSLNGDFHGFNPVWQRKAVIGKNTYSIETAVPLDSVSTVKDINGCVWRAGFFRFSEDSLNTSAWVPPMGNHNGVKKHGLIVFGSLQSALKKSADFAANRTKSTAAMQKILAEVQSVVNGNAASDPAAFIAALEKLSSLEAQLKKLDFAEKFASGKTPVIVQESDPYGAGIITAGNGDIASGIKADFYAGEVRDFAFNLTNVSKKSITIRAGFFGVKPSEFKLTRTSWQHMLHGLDHYKAEFFDPTPVASADGSVTADVLSPNPAGVWQLAPGETRQIFISVHAPRKMISTEGVLLIKSINEQTFEPMYLPVKFNTIAPELANDVKPITCGWDILMPHIVDVRPEFAAKHFQMLKDYGFNMTMFSGLRHLPRPKADKHGNLTGKMDFSILRKHIQMTGTLFDHYYLDVSIWEKHALRRDLFGLDFNHPAYEKAFKTWFAACVDELIKLGVPNERLVVCPLDEALDERAQRIGRWIKEVRPATKIIVDTSSNDLAEVQRMDKYTDVWMPHKKTLPQEALQEFHKYLLKGGKPRLLYYYSTGGNEKLKKPYGEYICNFYAVFARNFGGLGYWAAGQYYGDPWYRRNYTKGYDTALMYPTAYGPVPARRLAAWRRGAQDLWLLRATEKALGNNKDAVGKLREAARLAAEYPNDSQRGAELRQYCRKILAK